MLHKAVNHGKRRFWIVCFFDFLFAPEDSFGPTEVDIGGCQIEDALVVSVVVVMIDEFADGLFERSGYIVVFQQDTVLQGLVPSFDLALCLRVVRGTANVIHALIFKSSRQITRDLTAFIVAEQPRLVNNGGTVAT